MLFALLAIAALCLALQVWLLADPAAYLREIGALSLMLAGLLMCQAVGLVAAARLTEREGQPS